MLKVKANPSLALLLLIKLLAAVSNSDSRNIDVNCHCQNTSAGTKIGEKANAAEKAN